MPHIGHTNKQNTSQAIAAAGYGNISPALGGKYVWAALRDNDKRNPGRRPKPCIYLGERERYGEKDQEKEEENDRDLSLSLSLSLSFRRRRKKNLWVMGK